MTATQPALTTEEPPSEPRTGPWSSEEFEALADLIASGAGLDAIEKALARSRASVIKHLRLFLPPAERKCPQGVLLTSVQARLGTEAYDWRAIILQTPEPPPVTRIVRQGVEGLQADDLATVALALADRPGGRERDLLARVYAVLDAQGQLWLLRRRRASELQRDGAPGYVADEAASVWLDEHWPDGDSRYGRPSWAGYGM